MEAVAGALRWVARIVISIYLSTLLVFLMIEVSISGGMASVVLGAQSGVVHLDDEAYATLPQLIRDDVETYRLRDPVVVRHAAWALDAVRGDLGRTIGNQPVEVLVTPRLPISFQIAAVGLFLAVLIGIPAGLLGAILRRPGPQTLHQLGVATFQATPSFVLATFATWILAVRLGLLPAAGWERLSTSITGNLRFLTLPVAAVALPEAALIARVVMTSTNQVLGEEYVVAAQAKGLPRHQIFTRHVLRPASMTLLTQIGLVLSSLLGGVVIIERIYSIGGLGSVLFEGSINRDLHVVATLTAYLTFAIMVIRGLSEIAYRWADPRLR